MNSMKNNAIFPIMFGLIIVVFMSGCALFPTDDNYGKETVAIERVQTQGVRDVIAIENKDTSPKEKVLTNMDFTTFFTVANKDDEKNVKNLYVDLFNPFIFKHGDAENRGNDCDETNPCLPSNCDYTAPCLFLPLDEKFIEFELRSPSEDEIANLRTEAELDFSITYNFTGYYNYQVLVVSKDEIRERQLAGDTINKKLDASSSGGPIQISAESTRREYLLEGSDASIKFIIKDVGSNGELLGYNITNGTFEIKFPISLVRDDANIQPPEEFFECDPANGGFVRCRNIKDLELHGGETSPSIFHILDVHGSAGSMATHMIMANVDYIYELRDTFDVTIVLS